MAKRYKKNKRVDKKGLSSQQMSGLHKDLRKKGMSYKKALIIVGNAKKLSKIYANSKWKQGKFGKYQYFDFDRDGKVNRYDCRPFDKNRQDQTLSEQIATQKAMWDKKLEDGTITQASYDMIMRDLRNKLNKKIWSQDQTWTDTNVGRQEIRSQQDAEDYKKQWMNENTFTGEGATPKEIYSWGTGQEPMDKTPKDRFKGALESRNAMEAYRTLQKKKNPYTDESEDKVFEEITNQPEVEIK